MNRLRLILQVFFQLGEVERDVILLLGIHKRGLCVVTLLVEGYGIVSAVDHNLIDIVLSLILRLIEPEWTLGRTVNRHSLILFFVSAHIAFQIAI